MKTIKPLNLEKIRQLSDLEALKVAGGVECCKGSYTINHPG